MTPRAPLALVDGAPEAHEQMAAFLDGKATLPDNLAELGVIEPALWEELAGLEAARQQLIAADATRGVGRFVAVWQVDHA